MQKIALAVAASLIAGFAVGAFVAGDDASRKEAVPAAAGVAVDGEIAARLRQLEQVVAEERAARVALEDTLAMLFEDLERIESAGARAVPADAEARAERRAEAANSRSASRNDAERMANFQERRVARMVAGGFSEDEARRILEQEGEASYRAMRAAWEAERRGEPLDIFEMANDPQAILRAEIGDDAYARYLEAQGQPTAVNITQVLGGSPGKSAGLQPGDRLVSYNGERIFSVMELRELTMQGQPGEDVVIEVDRDGVRMQLTVPRGPIGISGSGAAVRGMRWWGG